MSRNFDKLINDKISEANIAPSSNLWDKIEAELDEKENRKVIIPFWSSSIFKQTIAASLIFLLGGISASYFFNNETTTLVAKTNIVLQNNNNKATLTNNQAKNNIVAEYNKNKKNAFQNHNFQNTTQNNTTLLSQENNKQHASNKNTSKVKSFIASIFKGNKNKPNNNTNKVNSTSYNNNNTIAKNNKEYNSASDYNWIYDKITNTYQVVLKQIYKQNNNNLFIDNGQNENALIIADNNHNINTILHNTENKESSTAMMSLIEKEDTVKDETLKIPEIEDSYRQFKTKIPKLNYQGFWLGPNVGYESVFAGGRHYPGASFGIDLGYDFGGSIGLQTGIRYAINTIKIKEFTEPNASSEYKSEFNSFHIPLLLRYKFTKLTQSYSRPLSLNLLAGADYAFVDQKNLHQLGFVLGAEYDIFTQADLMFTIGVKGSLNNNLNIATINITEKLNSFNYGLNAYLAVRFIDWAKKK